MKAFAPKRDLVLRLARDIIAKKYGEAFRYFDDIGIPQRVALRKEYNLKCVVLEDFYKISKKLSNKTFKELQEHNNHSLKQTGENK